MLDVVVGGRSRRGDGGEFDDVAGAGWNWNGVCNDGRLGWRLNGWRIVCLDGRRGRFSGCILWSGDGFVVQLRGAFSGMSLGGGRLCGARSRSFICAMCCDISMVSIGIGDSGIRIVRRQLSGNESSASSQLESVKQWLSRSGRRRWPRS